MRLLIWRRPDIARLERKGNLAGLLAALRYEDPLLDRSGRLVDLGAEVRVAAVEALGRLAIPPALEGVAGALNDPELSVRRAAVRVLARVDAGPATAALARAAVQWRSPSLQELREEATEALLARRDEGQSRHIAEELATLPDEPDDQDARLLRRLALSDGHASLQGVVSELAAYLRPRPIRAAKLLAALAPESVPFLIAMLEDRQVQAPAALALGGTHDSRAVEPLSRLLLESDQPAVRAASARALGEIRDPAAVESLLLAAADQDYTVRLEAGQAFDRFGNVAIVVAMSIAAAGQPALAQPTPEAPAHLEQGDDAAAHPDQSPAAGIVSRWRLMRRGARG